MQRRLQLNRSAPTAHTLDLMRGMVLRSRADERIRSAAHAVVRGCAPGDDVCRMRALLGYVCAVVPFERDPVEVEAISDPRLMLEQIHEYGTAQGDCDDAATFLSALLESIGIRTKLAAVSIRPDRVLHHVAVKAHDRRRDFWVMLDPYGPREVGTKPRFTAALERGIA